MEKWLQAWESWYDHINHTWSSLSDKDQEERLEHLEKAAESLLDTWTDMDEKLAILKTKLAERKPHVTYRSKGTTYYRLEMFTEAARTLELEKASGEQEELRQLYLAYCYLFTEEKSRAMELFLYILQVTRSVMIKHFAYIGLGCHYVQVERYDEAIDAFEHANILTPNEDVVYNLGICHYLNESFHVAEDYFIDAINIIPEDGEAYFYLGCCQWENGKIEDAFCTWLTCLQLLNTPYTLQALAHVCEWHGHHLAAIHCYKRMQALGVSRIDVLHGLAWNMALADMRKEAMLLFEELLKAEPENKKVKQSLQWLETVWSGRPLFS